jgi:hypothetical protein
MGKGLGKTGKPEVRFVVFEFGMLHALIIVHRK